MTKRHIQHSTQLIDLELVTGSYPAIAERLPRGLLIIPIAWDNIAASKPELPRLIHACLCPVFPYYLALHAR